MIGSDLKVDEFLTGYDNVTITATSASGQLFGSKSLDEVINVEVYPIQCFDSSIISYSQPNDTSDPVDLIATTNAYSTVVSTNTEPSLCPVRFELEYSTSLPYLNTSIIAGETDVYLEPASSGVMTVSEQKVGTVELILKIFAGRVSQEVFIQPTSPFTVTIYCEKETTSPCSVLDLYEYNQVTTACNEIVNLDVGLCFNPVSDPSVCQPSYSVRTVNGTVVTSVIGNAITFKDELVVDTCTLSDHFLNIESIINLDPLLVTPYKPDDNNAIRVRVVNCASHLNIVHPDNRTGVATE